MEPIELNGKTFCSNCGLAVGAPTQGPTNKISNFPQGLDANTPVASLDVPEPVEIPSTPLKDEAKRELGLEVDGPNDIIPADVPVAGPVKLTVSTEPEPPASSNIHESAATEPSVSELSQIVSEISEPASLAPTAPAPETVEMNSPAPIEGTATDNVESEPVNADLETPQVSRSYEIEGTDDDEQADITDPVENSDIPPLVNKIDIPDESEFEATPEVGEANQKEINDTKIKEVDTLGASGILLDILGDNLDQKQKQQDLDALDAASELIDDIKFEDNDTKKDTDSSTNKSEKNPHLDIAKTEPANDILDGEPQNPVENLELKSPLDELEITSGTPATENVAAATEVADELYVLPHQLAKKKTAKKKDTGADEKIKEEHDEKEIEKVEELLKKTVAEPVSLTPEEAEQYDPDTLPAGSTLSDDKQAILTEYFRVKMTDGKTSKKAKQKPVKAKKSGSKKKNRSWLIPAIIGASLIFVLALSTLIYIFLYQSPTKNIQVKATTATFDTQLPSYIVDGYQLTDSNTNPDSQIFTANYALASDSSKKITYTQAKPENISEYTANFTSTDGATITKKTIDNIEYTSIGDSTLLWTKGDFVYTIETTNYNLSVDLLYQMAQSVS